MRRAVKVQSLSTVIFPHNLLHLEEINEETGGFMKWICLSGSGSDEQEWDLDWCKADLSGAPSTIGLTFGPLLAGLLSGTHISK